MHLDDLRRQAEETIPLEEEEINPLPPGIEPPRKILGLTAAQRFFLAFLLLVTAILFSVSCLLLTGRVALPL